MFSLEFYKLLHLIGLMTLFSSLAGTWGGRQHKLLGALHGVALVVILVSGFGMLARLGYFHAGLPVWAYVKLAVWLAFGGLIAVVKRKPSPIVLLGLIALGGLAGFFGIYKPYN